MQKATRGRLKREYNEYNEHKKPWGTCDDQNYWIYTVLIIWIINSLLTYFSSTHGEITSSTMLPPLSTNINHRRRAHRQHFFAQVVHERTDRRLFELKACNNKSLRCCAFRWNSQWFCGWVTNPLSMSGARLEGLWCLHCSAHYVCDAVS